MSNFDEFLAGYAQTAAWADLMRPDAPDETGSGGSLADCSYDIADFDAESVQRMREECENFLAHHLAALEQYVERRAYDRSQGTGWAHAGHDFWLTRNRHGAGFWDRGLGELGDHLTEAADAYGDGGNPWLDGDVIRLG